MIKRSSLEHNFRGIHKSYEHYVLHNLMVYNISLRWLCGVCCALCYMCKTSPTSAWHSHVHS